MIVAQRLFNAMVQQCSSTVIGILTPVWSRLLLACMPDPAHISKPVRISKPAHMPKPVRMPEPVRRLKARRGLGTPSGCGSLNRFVRLRPGRPLADGNHDPASTRSRPFQSALIPFLARAPRPEQRRPGQRKPEQRMARGLPAGLPAGLPGSPVTTVTRTHPHRNYGTWTLVRPAPSRAVREVTV